MLEAGLEFEGEIDRVLTAFDGLPLSLRPIHFSHEEKVGNDKDRIDDRKRFAAFVAKNKSGFFLLGPVVTYSIRIAPGRPLGLRLFYGCGAGGGSMPFRVERNNLNSQRPARTGDRAGA